MGKKKRSKGQKTIFIVLGIALILIILMFVLVLPTNSTTTYFYDEDIGSIKVVIKERSFFDLFQQAVVFSPSTITIGEIVTLTDNPTFSRINCIDSVEVLIDPPGTREPISIFGQSSIWFPEDPLVTIITYQPDEVGEWTANTLYHEINCESPITDLGTTQQGSENIVTVNALPPNCDTTERCSTTEDSPTRTVQQCTREELNVDTCNEVTTKFITTCKDGYHIDGTSSDTTAEDTIAKTCILNEVQQTGCDTDLSLCTAEQVCVSNECLSTECNGNNIHECPDGVNVTLQVCSNQRWDPTQTVTIEVACVNNQINDTVTNETIQDSGQNEFWEIVNDVCVKDSTNETITFGNSTRQWETKSECDVNLSLDVDLDEGLNFGLIFIIITSIVVVTFGVIFFIRRSKK